MPRDKPNRRGGASKKHTMCSAYRIVRNYSFKRRFKLCRELTGNAAQAHTQLKGRSLQTGEGRLNWQPGGKQDEKQANETIKYVA